MTSEEELSELQIAQSKMKAHSLMEEALTLLDAAGEHLVGAKLDEAICVLGLRSDID